MSDIITLTDAAAAKIKEFIAQQTFVAPYEPVFRMKVVGGGCSGLSYEIGIETADETELQEASYINETYVVIDKKSALYLAGATVDYIDGLMQSGFHITNPNASHTCGCGSSFS